MSDGPFLKVRPELANSPRMHVVVDVLGRSARFTAWLLGVDDRLAIDVLCCAALRDVALGRCIKFWAVAPQFGKAHGDDLLLRPATLVTIDQLGEAPDLGRAMEAAGWAITEPDRESVRLPNFLEWNYLRAAKTPAERMRDSRARKREAGQKTVAQPLRGERNAVARVAQTRGDETRGDETNKAASAACSAASQATATEPPLITFPTRGKVKSWALTKSLIDELTADFPGIDVLSEARKAHAWCLADVQRHKSASGMRRFLTGWLNRTADSGRGHQHSTQHGIAGTTRRPRPGVVAPLEIIPPGPDDDAQPVSSSNGHAA